MFSGEALERLIPYAEQVASDAKDRYKWFRFFSWPFRSVYRDSTEASDLVSYLVLQTRFLTAKQFKAHKSMEVCGWVKEVKIWKISNY